MKKIIGLTSLVMVFIVLFLGVGIPLYLDWDKIFFRYRITQFYELRDYFNSVTLENEVFTYTIKGNSLYIYGVTGYTKVNLGFMIHVTKIMNPYYEKNFISTVEGRGTFHSSIDELRNTYKDRLKIENNFNSISDFDLDTFMDLYRQDIKAGNIHTNISVDDVYYKNGNQVVLGLEKLNRMLIGTYYRREKDRVNNNGKYQIKTP